MNFDISGGSWTGKHHASSEDEMMMVIRADRIAALVVDGMGGLPQASAAARACCDIWVDRVCAGVGDCGSLLRAMNDRLGEQFGWDHVGAAAACAFLDADATLRFAWIGDCRIYSALSTDLHLVAMTHDHSKLGARLGLATPRQSDIRRLPRLASNLIRSLGERPLSATEVAESSRMAQGVRRAVLCTDGAWSDRYIPQLWWTGSPPGADYRPTDDASAIVITVREKSTDSAFVTEGE